MILPRSSFRSTFTAFITLFLWTGTAMGQEPQEHPPIKAAPRSQPEQGQAPWKQATTSKELKTAPSEKDSSYYHRWLNEDVRWIITDEELGHWKKLTTNAQRDVFIEAFWERRNPNPGSSINAYKEGHYRRIAYANEHFSSQIPGWRSDRGRMYIMYGPPDSLESHSGGAPRQPGQEEGGIAETYPYEMWRYHHLEGVGDSIEIEFVDSCRCGEYRMPYDRRDDGLAHVPPFIDRNQPREFEPVKPSAAPNPDPKLAGKCWEGDSFRLYNCTDLSLDLRVDFVRTASDDVLAPITLQVDTRQLTFVKQDGVERATVNVFGQVRRLTGNLVDTFAETVSVDAQDDSPKDLNHFAVYWHALRMHPGHYRLDVLVQDVNGDKVDSRSQALIVPGYAQGKLASSSFILADAMQPANAASGKYVLGGTLVRPRVAARRKPATFVRGQDPKLHLWMQIYNLTRDEKTNRCAALLQYQIVNRATGKFVVDFNQSTDKTELTDDQSTLRKSLSLSHIDPGLYQVTIKIRDLVSKQTISPEATFEVN